jgi:SSS family solute:Na+ symporter
MAWLLAVVAGVPKATGCAIGGVVVTAYFAAGGLLTSARLNMLQLVVKMAGIALAVPFAVAHAGGWAELTRTAASHPGYWTPWATAARAPRSSRSWPRVRGIAGDPAKGVCREE